MRRFPKPAALCRSAHAWVGAGLLLLASLAAAQQNQVDLMGSPRLVRQAREAAPGAQPTASATANVAASAPKRPQFIDISKAEKPPSRESLSPPPAAAAKPGAEKPPIAINSPASGQAKAAPAAKAQAGGAPPRSALAAQIESALEIQEKAARTSTTTRSREAVRPVMPVPNQATPPKLARNVEVHDEVAADEAFLKARARALGIAPGAPQPGVRRVVARPAPSEVAAGAPWAYDGPTGPEAWGRLKPEYRACADGRRQSPLNIRDEDTIVGPAEPLGLRTSPSAASVVNTSRTVQVDVLGDNTFTLRGVTYKLSHLQFHHPAEALVNGKGFAMSVHLVHRSEQGQLAVVAVMVEAGAPSPFLESVWTYMPLDVGDRVPMPPQSLDVSRLFPQDMRYFQYIGSLTAPPCTEGVLWVVLKAPVTASAEQIRFFAQIYPHNARPPQPQHGRVVREER